MAFDIDTECAPSRTAPTKFLFYAVDELSVKFLTEKWTGSIKFRSPPVCQILIGARLEKTCMAKIDICDYLLVSQSILVVLH